MSIRLTTTSSLTFSWSWHNPDFNVVSNAAWQCHAELWMCMDVYSAWLTVHVYFQSETRCFSWIAILQCWCLFQHWKLTAMSSFFTLVTAGDYCSLSTTSFVNKKITKDTTLPLLTSQSCIISINELVATIRPMNLCIVSLTRHSYILVDLSQISATLTKC